MKIRTVIVDDEDHVIKNLKQVFKAQCPQVKLIGTADNLREAKQLLIAKPVDLAFLDIKLNDGNIFSLLKDLRPIDFNIVFITAHDQYAVEAFRFSALDFLLKPIDPDELMISVARVEKALYKESLELRINALFHNQASPKQEHTLVLRTAEAYHVIRIKDIVRCEAQGNYTLFHLKDRSTILVSQTLKKYDDLLSKHGFFRCHQSHLVNLSTILRFERRDGGALKLKNDMAVPVAPRRREQLFDILSI